MNTKQTITVWDGVKIGCGIFIVLPCLILAFFLLILGVPTCGAIKEQRAKEKQRREATERENDSILAIADTDGDGVITKMEYLTAKEAYEAAK
jgi:hypothetical protein